MSGSGGGRDDYEPVRKEPGPLKPSGGGSGGGGGSDPCDLIQDAPLNSPQQTVVNALSVGVVLDVVLSGTAPNEQLVVQTKAGQLAGSLTHRGHVAIIDCINSGHVYEAVVTSKSSGFVQVRVQPA